MIGSLLFLLVMVFSLLAPVRDYDFNHDPGSDAEMLWHSVPAGTSMEDAIQKLAK